MDTRTAQSGLGGFTWFHQLTVETVAVGVEKKIECIQIEGQTIFQKNVWHGHEILPTSSVLHAQRPDLDCRKHMD